MAQCRLTLDHLATVAGAGSSFDDKAIQNLLVLVTDNEKRRRLAALLSRARDVSHDTHHERVTDSGQQRITYDIDEARFVLAVTSAAIEWIGSLLARR